MLVLGSKEAGPALARLSLLRIRDFLTPTMSGTRSCLELLPAILHAADPVLARHLAEIPPHFGVAAVLTLFAHDVEEYGGIARLFDFLLAREAVILLYMFVVVCSSENETIPACLLTSIGRHDEAR